MSSGKPFKDLIPPLIPEILDTLQEMTFTTATPVQGAVIPYFLSHKDVNASACTGSGKTLSFLIPMFQILAKSESCNKPGEIGGIIISPTRELALQTFSVAQKFESHLPNIHVVLLTGGNEVADDLKQLQSDKCLIIIATPGRLKDIMERQGERFAVRNLEVLILDEADVLLVGAFSIRCVILRTLDILKQSVQLLVSCRNNVEQDYSVLRRRMELQLCAEQVFEIPSKSK